MRTEYKRDMNHNYLILTGDERIDTDSYQVRMIVANAVPDLLQCRIQGIDGKFMVYYDITSRHSMTALLRKKDGSGVASGDTGRIYTDHGRNVRVSFESLSADPGTGIYLSGCGKKKCPILLSSGISWGNTETVSESCGVYPSKAGS